MGGSLGDIGKLRARLLRRARRYAPDAAAAEDLVQEALLRVWARLAEDPPIDTPERYLFVSMRNLARRRGAAHAALNETDLPPCPPVAGDRLAAARVIRALGRLPEERARLIRAHAVGGESFADLARREGLAQGTVTSRVARGRAELCAALGVPRERPVEALLERIA